MYLCHTPPLWGGVFDYHGLYKTKKKESRHDETTFLAVCSKQLLFPEFLEKLKELSLIVLVADDFCSRLLRIILFPRAKGTMVECICVLMPLVAKKSKNRDIIHKQYLLTEEFEYFQKFCVHGSASILCYGIGALI
jgi:hypothetical protein